MGKKGQDSGGKKRGKQSSGSGVGTILAGFGVAIAVLAVGAGVYQLKMAPQAAGAAVLHLKTEETFTNFVATHQEGALIDFYSEGCPHCKKLEPEFEAAAKELKAKGGAALASVDAADLPKIIRAYKVTRYPTMLWFYKGESVLELGPHTRDKAKLVEYADWASQPGLGELDTRAEFDEALPQLRQTLTASSPPMIVGFEGTDGLYAALDMASQKLRGKAAFLWIKEAGAEGPALRAVSQDTSTDKSYEGPMTPDAVHKWASETVVKPKKA